jgi:acetate---CoA ligase (ADP-forming)
VTELHTEPRREARSLEAVFDPGSLAIVGASNVSGKWGYFLSQRALKGEHRRRVYLINRKGSQVLGRDTYREFDELPEAPEMAVLAVPLSSIEDTMRAAIAAGTKAFIGISSGFAEIGPEGAARQRALVELVHEAGALLVGPNCPGVMDTETDLDVSWIQLGNDSLPPGSIGLISQSGGVAYDAGMQALEVGLGFSRFLALGNQADVTAAEGVRSMLEHERTRLIALYLEDFRDGRELLRAIADAVAAGKPVVVIAPTGGEAVGRAAAGHTAALTTDRAVIDKALREAGAHFVDTANQMMDLAELLLRTERFTGTRLGLLSESGGSLVQTTSLAGRSGLDVPRLGEGVQARLREILGPEAAVQNPVDAVATLDPQAFAQVTDILYESGEVDAVLRVGQVGVYEGVDDTYEQAEYDTARAAGSGARRFGLPFVCQTPFADARAVAILRDSGGAVFGRLDIALATLARAARVAGAPSVPAIPEPSEPVAATDYFSARALLADAGITFPRAVRVESGAAAVAAGDVLGYPLALKAVSALHKSDAGGVVLGIAGPAELELRFRELRERLGPGAFSVEQMIDVPNGVELIVGARRDPRFGPILLVGLGGVLAEVLDDHALALAPAGPANVREMLAELRGAPLLTGMRGSPPIDLDAVAAAAARLSEVAASHPELAEIEINPLLAFEGGAIALDARMLPAEGEPAGSGS